MNPGTLSRMGRSIALVAAVAAIMLLGANNSAWATPAQRPAGQTIPTVTPGAPAAPDVIPPPLTGAAGEAQERVAPGIAATVSTGDGDATVILPANALSASGTLVLRPSSADAAPPANAGFALLGKAVEITLFDAQGKPIAHPSFANPIQVCFAYSAGDLAKVGGNAEALVVQFYDTAASKWVALPTTVDVSSGRACGSS